MATPPPPTIHSGTPRATDTLIVAHAIDFKTSKSGYLPRQVKPVKPRLDDVTKKYKELQLVNDVKDASRNFIASHLGESGSQIGPRDSVLLFSDTEGLVEDELPKNPGRYTAIVPATVVRNDPLVGVRLPDNVAAFNPCTLDTVFSPASNIQAQMDNLKEMLNEQKKSSDQLREQFDKLRESFDKQEEWFDEQIDKQKEWFDEQIDKQKEWFDEQIDKQKEWFNKQIDEQKESFAKLKGDILVLKESVSKLKETTVQLTNRAQILENRKEGFHAISNSAPEWITLRDPVVDHIHNPWSH